MSFKWTAFSVISSDLLFSADNFRGSIFPRLPYCEATYECICVHVMVILQTEQGLKSIPALGAGEGSVSSMLALFIPSLLSTCLSSHENSMCLLWLCCQSFAKGNKPVFSDYPISRTAYEVRGHRKRVQLLGSKQQSTSLLCHKG